MGVEKDVFKATQPVVPHPNETRVAHSVQHGDHGEKFLDINEVDQI